MKRQLDCVTCTENRRSERYISLLPKMPYLFLGITN